VTLHDLANTETESEKLLQSILEANLVTASQPKIQL
jgi:hypothetical protein